MRAWPSSASVASMGGDTVPPDTATRSWLRDFAEAERLLFREALERGMHRRSIPGLDAPRIARAIRPAMLWHRP